MTVQKKLLKRVEIRPEKTRIKSSVESLGVLSLGGNQLYKSSLICSMFALYGHFVPELIN